MPDYNLGGPDGYPDPPPDIDLIDEFDQAVANLLRRTQTITPEYLDDLIEAINRLIGTRNQFMADTLKAATALENPKPTPTRTTRKTTTENKEN